MNKSELIDAIAASADISKAAAGRALDAVTESITQALKNNDQVALVGFGTFVVKERAARTGDPHGRRSHHGHIDPLQSLAGRSAGLHDVRVLLPDKL